MSVAVNLSRAWPLSSHIHNMCSEAREAIYTREADVKHWLDKGTWRSSERLRDADMVRPNQAPFNSGSIKRQCANMLIYAAPVLLKLQHC